LYIASNYVRTLTGSPESCVMTCRFSPDNISGAWTTTRQPGQTGRSRSPKSAMHQRA
jgi:hypothetical protein